MQPTILVIDDEPDNFDVIETLLDSEAYQLSYVSSGQQAFNLLHTFQPDIILLDVMMPNMNGLEFCKRFKSNPEWQYIPVIMVTALTAKDDLAQCLAAGADDFISKPINGVEFRARVRSMLRIRHQHEMLQKMLQLRADLSDMVVHDLRNPLTTIVLATEILRLPNLPSQHQQKKLDQIAKSSQQLQCLIDSLLLLAKMEADRMVLQLVDVDLNTLCAAAVADMEAIAAQKSLELVADLPVPGVSVSVDPVVFRRILDNLLANAIKFSPSKSKVVLKADYREGGQATIQVADSGPGITEEMKQRVFEKFETGTFMKDIPQVGLGLAFCKMAVQAHGGHIQVEQNHPQGAIFTIDL